MRSPWLAVIAVLALCLGGCSENSTGSDASLVPPLIAKAIHDERLDPEAAAECTRLYPQSTFIVAFRTTAGEIANSAVVPPGEDAADTEGLPRDSGAPALVCISSGTREDTTVFMATWASGGGEGVISIFDEGDLLAAGA